MSDEREKLREQLSAFLDGQLTPEETQRLKAAMEADALLRAELESLRATRNLLKRLPRESAPPNLLVGTLEEAARRNLVRPPGVLLPARKSHWPRYAALAALVVLGVSVGVYLAGGFGRHAGQAPPGPTIVRTQTGTAEQAGKTDSKLQPSSDMYAARGRETAGAKGAADRLAREPESGATGAGKGGATGRFTAGQRLVAQRRVVLNTNNLEETNGRISAVLAANSVQLGESSQAGAAGRENQMQRVQSRANVAGYATSTETHSEIMVFVDSAKVPGLIAELEQLDASAGPAQAGGPRASRRGGGISGPAETKAKAPTASPASPLGGSVGKSSYLKQAENAPAPAAVDQPMAQQAQPPMGELVEVVIAVNLVPPQAALAPPATQPHAPAVSAPAGR